MAVLYSHQKRIVDENPTKTGLFLGTGSGKTRTALLLSRGATLVIAPKTQKEDGNWEREFNTLLNGGHDFGPRYHLEVISKETFRRDHELLPSFDTVIVDEAHTCLGVTPATCFRKRIEYPKTSQLFEALDTYLKRVKPGRIYLCTATIMKSPMTVWGAWKILRGDHMTSAEAMSSFLRWRNLFYTKLPMPGRQVYAPKKDLATKENLAKFVLGVGYVGRLEDYFDVPDQTYRTVHVELTPKQKDRIKELRLEYPEPIVRIGKRHQVENGCLAGDEFSDAELFENAKVEKLVEYSIEFPRMVVFAKYKAQIRAIEEAIRKTGKPVLVLTGETKDRGELIAAANRMPECVFIAQAQISAGWELPEFPVMVFASRTYSLVDYDQALGRIQRANNIKKNLYINLVVKGGIDEAVDRALADKVDFNEKLYAEANQDS